MTDDQAAAAKPRSRTCPEKPAGRSRKIYVLWAIALTLLTLIGLGCAFWRPVGLAVLRHQTGQKYRRDFAKGSGHMPTDHEADWAVAFGGTCSISLLDELAMDQSISAPGRSQIRYIRAMVHDGKHLSYLKEMIDSRKGLTDEVEAPGGVQGALLEYIYERDNEYLKQRQIAQ